MHLGTNNAVILLRKRQNVSVVSCTKPSRRAVQLKVRIASCASTLKARRITIKRAFRNAKKPSTYGRVVTSDVAKAAS